MFSEGPLELHESISSKIVPINPKEKEIVKKQLLFTKEKQTKCQNPQLFHPFLSASAAIHSLAELLPN